MVNPVFVLLYYFYEGDLLFGAMNANLPSKTNFNVRIKLDFAESSNFYEYILFVFQYVLFSLNALNRDTHTNILRSSGLEFG